MVTKELLYKFDQTPGYCNYNEVKEVNAYYTHLKHLLDLFGKEYIPPMGAIEKSIATTNWYLNRLAKDI